MLKRQILNLMFKSGAFAPVRYFNRAKTPILMYHRFSAGEEFLKTSQQIFINHLEYLTKHYKIISLADFANRLKTGEPVPPNAAVITIDDGYDDAYKIAYPILKKFSAPATLFVVTGFLDKKCWIWTDKSRFVLSETKADKIDFEISGERIGENLNGKNSRLNIAAGINARLKKLTEVEREDKLNALSKQLNVSIPETPPAEFAPIDWGNALEMDRGILKIESHTATHPILTETNSEQLKMELEDSRGKLENVLQRRMQIFCYPNGNNGEREQKAVEAAGYECAVSTEIRLCGKTENIFSIPRIDAESEMRRFVQATSGLDELKSRSLRTISQN